MKVLFWNARGLANQETRLVLSNICKMNTPDFILLSVPWILVDAVPGSHGFQIDYSK